MRRLYRGRDTLMLVADSFDEYEDIVLTGDEPIKLVGTVVWAQSQDEMERGKETKLVNLYPVVNRLYPMGYNDHSDWGTRC